MKSEFRLDRTSFRAMTMEEADKAMTDYTDCTWQERFKIANYLNSVAYNYPLNNPPKMDKTICTPRNLVYE